MAACGKTANVEKAEREKEHGNECFKRGEYGNAVECYTRGLALTETAILYANRAMARLRLGRPAEAKTDCDLALQVDSSYTKALFRRGLAHKELGNRREATEDFEAVLSLEPNHGLQAQRMLR